MTMTEGMNVLLENIAKFEKARDELNQAIKDGHVLLKDLKAERKEIERLFTTEVREMVRTRADEVVKTELGRLGPEIRDHTNLIYDKVGDQIDKLTDIALGKELSTKRGHEDLRPILGAKLREFIQEIITEEGY